MSSFYEIVDHIFGYNLLKPLQDVDLNSGSFGPLISALNNNLLSQNIGTEQIDDVGVKTDPEDGRIGNVKVSFDLLGLSSRILSSDSLKIIGVSHFGTIKTNCGVCRGKWQYEVLLLSSGVMQIGWATSKSLFGAGQGVGDTSDSFGYDGSRVRKWNVTAEDYGEKWEEGDLIGCCIDLDEGFVEFFRNGNSMGVAFKEVQMGPGIVYFPTVSLQQKEGLVANFGSTPFYYPVHGYHSIQEPPNKEILSVSYLLECKDKLLSLMDKNTIVSDEECDGLMSHEAMLMEIGKILTLNLVPLLTNPYIVEEKLIPFIQSLCESENPSSTQVRPSARVAPHKHTPHAIGSRKLTAFLDIMMAFSEKHELEVWTSILISRLSAKFQHIRPSTLEFSLQKNALMVLRNLVSHKKLRHYLMNHVLFEEMRLPGFMNIKVYPCDSNTFWEIEHSAQINSRAFMASVNRLTSAVNSLEELQTELLLTLMDDTDGSTTKPSSRRIFLGKFRTLRQQFYALYRVAPQKTPGSSLYLVHPFFLRLLHVVEVLWSREVGDLQPTLVSPSKFYDGSIPYYDIDRLGGVLLYLLKAFPNDSEHGLETSQPTHETAVTDSSRAVVESSTSTSRGGRVPEEIANLATGIFDIFEDIVHLGSWSDQQTMMVNDAADDFYGVDGPLDSHEFLTELLDGLIIFYHISFKTSPPIYSVIVEIKISSCEEKIMELVKTVSEIKDTMKAFLQSSTVQPQDTMKTMEMSHNVILSNLNLATAQMATLQALRYPNRHSWFYKVILNTMKASSEDIRTFSFVPEFYLDCLVEVLKQLSYETKTSFAEFHTIHLDHNQILQGIVQFLCDHINDQRVRIAKAKDTLLISLLEIVMNPDLIEVLHNIPTNSQLNMIQFLLQPYENRAWANSNWILVRLWYGSPRAFGCKNNWAKFCYTLKPRPMTNQINPPCFKNDPCPSTVLQELIQSLLIDEPHVATSFINSVINQVNWAFSEFIGMLQENVSNRRERVLIESRQLKICATCFDLTLALLRVLEMVTTLALSVFVRFDQQNSNVLLARLCQLLCQVLNRASSHDGCFHHITTLQIPGLENINHCPILTAVSGILLALLKEDMENFAVTINSSVPRATETLLKEPSFQMSSFTFLTEKDPNLFSLNYYEEFITPEEVSLVEKLIVMLVHYHRIVTDTNAASNAFDEDDMCTICFAFPVATIFEPCKHHSCRACITHHLMNCQECFFCKAVITKVVDDDGTVIYEIQQNELMDIHTTG